MSVSAESHQAQSNTSPDAADAPIRIPTHEDLVTEWLYHTAMHASNSGDFTDAFMALFIRKTSFPSDWISFKANTQESSTMDGVYTIGLISARFFRLKTDRPVTIPVSFRMSHGAQPSWSARIKTDDSLHLSDKRSVDAALLALSNALLDALCER